jgi:hypothetical protein
MHLVRTPPSAASRFATAEEVADIELAGTWVVDVRREPRSPVRAGWLVDWEDDIAFLMDSSAALHLPLDAA